MTVGELRDELTKMLGNTLASAGHPFVNPIDFRYRWITRAVNKIPRLAYAAGFDPQEYFRELFATFKAATTLNQAYVNRPADALLVREMRSFDKTPANFDADEDRLVARLDPIPFGAMERTNVAAGYPQNWSNRGLRLYITPTPDALHLTDIHLYGLKRQVTTFNDPNQAILLGDDWHEAVLFESARAGAVALGYFERAAAYKAELMDLMAGGMPIPALEEAMEDNTFESNIFEDME